MSDLRALLGDRYVSTLRAAVLADNPDAITSAQQVGGQLGQLMYLSATRRLDRTLAAVLPGLLADAWDECTTAWQAHLDGRTDNVPPLNPYRTEGDHHE